MALAWFVPHKFFIVFGENARQFWSLLQPEVDLVDHGTNHINLLELLNSIYGGVFGSTV